MFYKTEPVFEYPSQWVGKVDEKYAFSSSIICSFDTPARKYIIYSPLYLTTGIS